MSRTPTRTCVGCRQTCPATALVRIVAPDDRVALATPRSTGRGAWLHPVASCVEKAIKTRAFSRAFRRAVNVAEPAQLIETVVRAATVIVRP